MKGCIFKVLALVFILCSFLQSSAQVSGWKYFRKIQLNNIGGSALKDYQIPVVIDASSLIMAGKMKSDASDIRFTDSTGTVFFPYWLETSANNTQAKFWVKIPAIPASSMYALYMAYGNSAATAVSNGNDVFELFDDFSQTTLDKNKWTIREGRNYPTYHSINNGIIRVYSEKQSFNPGAFLVSKKSTDLTGKVLETRMATYDNGVKSQYIALYSDTNFYPGNGQFLMANRLGYTNAFTNNQLGINGSWVTSGTKYPLPMEFNNASLLATPDLIKSTFKDEPVTTFQRPASTNGFLYIGAPDDYSGINGGLLIDYLFLRAYTAIEPVITTGAESINTAIAEENQEVTFQVFPNPANTHINLLTDNLLKNTSLLIITNASGQQVYSRIIAAGTKNITVPVENLTPGIYLLHLNGQNIKFIKN